MDRELACGSQLGKSQVVPVQPLGLANALSEEHGSEMSVMHWMRTMVVRPIITYAAIIWWRMLKHKIIQAKLNKLQRLACPGIVGDMETSPMAAIDVLKIC